LAYLWAIRAILPPGRPLLPFVAFPALLFGIGIGQNALLTAALFGGGLALLERRPWLAGALFGALCYKPHFAVLIPVALLAGRYGRAFAAAALTVSAMIGLSLLLDGPETWRAFLAVSDATTGTFSSGRIPFSGLISPYGALRQLGLANHPALAAQFLVGLAMAATVAVIWRGQAPYPAKAMVLVAATLLSPPVILIYDLTLGTVAMAWAWRDASAGGGPSRFLPWEKTGFALVYMISMVSRSFALAGSPLLLGPLASLTLLAFGLLRARRLKSVSV
jgi:hypothetical protein